MEVSPLFAMRASKLLDQGELEDAVQLCEQGLEKWPDYMVAYAIMAKAHLGLDNPQSAIAAINKGLVRFPREHSLIELRMMAVATLNGVQDIDASEFVIPEEDAAPHSSPSPETTATDLQEPDEPVTEEPVADESVADEPVTEEPVADESVADEQVADESVADEPVAEESVAEEPVAEEPVAEEPVAEEPVAEEPVAEEPVAEEPVAEEPVAEEPVADEQVAAEPVADESVAEESVADEPVAEESVAEEPVAEEPVADESVAEEPVADESVAEEPVAEEPVEEGPPLRLVEAVPAHDSSTEFNSGNVRLIPGLEYHNLSIGTSQMGLQIAQRVQAPEPPGFPTIHIDEVLQQPVKKLTPLEELARRLGAKTIEPESKADDSSDSPPPAESNIAMTETIANIYAMQGAWQEVITAYQALKKKHPEKAAEYDKRIAEAQAKL